MGRRRMKKKEMSKSSSSIMMIDPSCHYEEIEISKLDDDLMDARDHSSASKKIIDEIHIDTLADNISKLGLLEPIIVTKKKAAANDNRYSIVAGRYRTLACKKLNWKKIPCQIRNIKNKYESTAITVSENVKRKQLDLDEKIQANLMYFTVRGYTDEEIMHYSKKIHNFGSKDIPESFLDAMEICDYSPNYLYQIMQTLIYLPESVQKVVKEQKLSIDKRILLTNTKLREHPKIAIKLIKDIKGLKIAHARVKVNQEIRDLETQATVKTGNSYIFDPTKREKVDTKIMTEKTSVQYYLELTAKVNELLHILTGHRLAQGETYYEPNHVDNTQKHRTDIIKSLTRGEALKLENDIQVLNDALSSTLDILNQEVK